MNPLVSWSALFSLCLVIVATAQEPPRSLDQLEVELEAFRWELGRPRKELKESYDAALERLAIDEQKKGNFDAVLAIKKEREALRDEQGAKANTPVIAAISKLREIYRERDGKLEAEAITGELKLLDAYLEKLAPLKKTLTVNGDLAEANKVAERESTVKERQKRLTIGRIDNALGSDNEEVVGPTSSPRSSDQLSVVEEEGIYLLTSPDDHQRIESSREFVPPYQLIARASRRSSSLRLYFGEKGRVIFNWEKSEDELRVHDPVDGRNQSFYEAGYLEADTMVELVVRVESDRVTVYVDRQPVAEYLGNFSESKGPIGIGPAFGGVIGVEKLVGVQEE